MDILEQLHSKIYRFKRQHFYDERVNIYLIELDEKIILFDIPNFSQATIKSIKKFNKPLVAILSHGPCGIADGTLWQQKFGVIIYLHILDEHNKWLKLKPNILFSKAPYISKEIEIIHTPGHTPGSVCLFHKMSQSLFTGDTFQMNEKGDVIDFTDNKSKTHPEIRLRLESTKKLLNKDFNNVFPFHYFHSINNNAKNKLSNYITNHNY